MVILRDGMRRVLAAKLRNEVYLEESVSFFAPTRRYNSIQDDEDREKTPKRNSIHCDRHRKTN